MKKWIALLVMIAVGFGVVLEHVFLQMWQAKPLLPLSTTMLYLPNGEPGTVRVNVRDSQGTPVEGAEEFGWWIAQARRMGRPLWMEPPSSRSVRTISWGSGSMTGAS